MTQRYQGTVVNVENHIFAWNESVLIAWSVVVLKDVRMNEGLVETAWCSCGFVMKTSGTQLRLKGKNAPCWLILKFLTLSSGYSDTDSVVLPILRWMDY